ncbi:bifunctional ADP-dependent NAD(P)H-hydrate dehydratase/NAD(P)H-hydrate epimerase [Salinicola socius]|uniref:Bifunctional NAD(P)H-hydrate repair enzyme n=1 Tax=Salinicola socius TaxID=404433 RepID=A0A1Q8SSJ5_9GAMM|nr:bifunctional ADP-dependent NAD(P)H-hydrate dehydratase/NAD(P)H-hydrate epimerase [Salinicola socius]OLO04410.1 bifunctional ADP-dependent (S)-NAD(P)H-hydrate dehydratase/NAD(P)H-hydrate epimerase [Salinicola socius]
MSASFSQRPLYLADQVRELDRRTIEAEGDSFALMRRAGESAYDTLRARWPQVRRLCVLCGGGNNGGDGYVIAALAAADGLVVELVALKPAAELEGSARKAAALAAEAGVEPIDWADELTLDGELIIDAMLGTGARGAPRPPYAAAIAEVNASGRPVVAIDVPSGVDVDTGHVEAAAVRATLTITFIGDKFGLHTGAALDAVGEIIHATLGVDPRRHADIVPVAWRQTREDLAIALPPRAPNSHKGSHGHVLVVAGAPGMGGAALMTSEMVARVGAGKVSLATDVAHVSASLTRFPEIMARGVRGAPDIEAMVETADVLAVGPGIGTGAWGQAALQSVLAAGKSCVLDADALNLLAGDDGQSRRDDWILTPHPGEAGRLLGLSTGEVQRDRRHAVIALQRRWGGTIVLKGAGTLVYDGERLTLCPFGNPGMGSGGMGDALTGIISGLVGQLGSLGEAARIGVLLHALAADAAALDAGERGLLATDLASYARTLANPQSVSTHADHA